MLKKKWMVTSFLVLALGLTACTEGDGLNDQSADDNPPIEDNNVDETDDNNENVDNNTNYEDDQEVDPGFSGKYGEIMIVNDAYDIFTGKNAEAKLEQIELDYDDGVYLYEIKGFDEDMVYKMKINAITGELVKYKEESEKREKQYLSEEYLNTVEEYLNKAIQGAGDDIEYLEWDLEIENGRPEIEIEVERTSGQVEYTYDLESGKLLEKD